MASDPRTRKRARRAARRNGSGRAEDHNESLDARSGIGNECFPRNRWEAGLDLSHVHLFILSIRSAWLQAAGLRDTRAKPAVDSHALCRVRRTEAVAIGVLSSELRDVLTGGYR